MRGHLPRQPLPLLLAGLAAVAPSCADGAQRGAASRRPTSAFAFAAGPAVAPPLVVPFEGDSASLGDAAHRVVSEAAALAIARPSVPVYLAPTGPAEAAASAAGPGAGRGRSLPEARADSVASALIRRGIPAGRIRLVPRDGPSPSGGAAGVEIRIGR